MLSVRWRHAVCLLLPGLPSAFSLMEACCLLADNWITQCFQCSLIEVYHLLVDSSLGRCFLQFGEDMLHAVKAGGFSFAQVPYLGY